MQPRLPLSVVLAALASAVAIQPRSSAAQIEIEHHSPADTASPGTNRLFFAPTGRTLPAGVSEVGTYYLIAPYFTYAFHDRFMAAAGTPLVPGAFGRYWYLAPKAGLVSSRLVSVAAGAFLILDVGGDPLDGSDVVQSFAWGVATFGGPRAALTVGLASDIGRLDGLPDGELLILGGEYELVQPTRGPDALGLRLIAESYMNLPGVGESFTDASLHMVGLRFRAGRVAIEVVEGLLVENGELETWTGVPLFNMSVLF